MIAISAALLLLALILLLTGWFATGLALVYASIAVTVLGGVALLLAIRDRRGVVAYADEGAAPEVVRAVTDEGDSAPASTAPTAPARAVPEPGRAGLEAAVAPAETARPAEPAEIARPAEPAETARPAEPALAAPTGLREPAEPPPEDDDELLEDLDEPFGGLVYVVAGRPRYHVEGCRYLVGRQIQAAEVLDAREQGFSPCGVCRPDAALAAELALYEDSSGRPADGEPAGGGPHDAMPADGGPADAMAADELPATAPVVVLPDRGRFHRSGCRYVRDAPRAVTLRREQAVRQGYVACGTCRP